MKRMHSRGFTLIEMLITIVVISILSAIAVPAYSHYVLRGKLSEATNTLSSTRISMEQWYQDNKTYAASSGSACGVANPTGINFSYSCALTGSGTGYVWTATGSGQANGYSYTISDANAMTTATVGAGARCSTSSTAWNTNC